MCDRVERTLASEIRIRFSPGRFAKKVFILVEDDLNVLYLYELIEKNRTGSNQVSETVQNQRVLWTDIVSEVLSILAVINLWCDNRLYASSPKL